MNLVDILNGRLIGGLRETEFRSVLIGQHDTVRVKNATKGLIILSNDAVVKCVNNYYRHPTNTQSKKRSKSSTHDCYYVQKDLEIDGVDLYNCMNCHLRCLTKRAHKELRRLFKA